MDEIWRVCSIRQGVLKCLFQGGGEWNRGERKGVGRKTRTQTATFWPWQWWLKFSVHQGTSEDLTWMTDLFVSTGNCLQRHRQFHGLNITLCLCFQVSVLERETKVWAGSQNAWLERKGRLILPNTQYGHRPLAVQAMGDISLSASRIQTDSTDPHDYFPLATPREKLFLCGDVGTS